MRAEVGDGIRVGYRRVGDGGLDVVEYPLVAAVGLGCVAVGVGATQDLWSGLPGRADRRAVGEGDPAAVVLPSVPEPTEDGEHFDGLDSAEHQNELVAALADRVVPAAQSDPDHSGEVG